MAFSMKLPQLGQKYQNCKACCSPPNPVPSLHRVERHMEKILSVKHKYPSFFPIMCNADCGNGREVGNKVGEKPHNLLLALSLTEPVTAPFAAE